MNVEDAGSPGEKSDLKTLTGRLKSNSSNFLSNNQTLKQMIHLTLTPAHRNPQ